VQNRLSALSQRPCEGKPIMANVNITYAEMEGAATQLRSNEQDMHDALVKLKGLIDNLVQSGYVTDSSSKKFDAAYTEFTNGAGKVIGGLTGMAQYLEQAAQSYQHLDAELAAAVNNGS
jgi:WXG100 family type VII secretion target